MENVDAASAAKPTRFCRPKGRSRHLPLMKFDVREHDIPSKCNSLTGMFFKLSDPRRKGWQQVQPLRWSAKKKPQLLRVLLHRMQVKLNPGERRLAHSRFFSVVGSTAARQMKYELKLPHLGRIHPATVLRECYCHQFSALMKRGFVLLIKVGKSLPPSCTFLLCNDKRWASEVDTIDFPCNSTELGDLRQAPRSPLCAHVVSIANHSPLFKKKLPVNLHYGTRIVPNHQSTCCEFNTHLNKLVRKLKIKLDHSLMIRKLYDIHGHLSKQHHGVKMFDIIELKSSLGPIAVVGPLGKNQENKIYVFVAHGSISKDC